MPEHVISPETGVLSQMLHINDEKLTGLEQRLGRFGVGAFHIPGVLDQTSRQTLLNEISDRAAVLWSDVQSEYVNIRGKTIVQNHEVFGLKLSMGDMGYVERVPRMKQLADETQAFVQRLSEAYPILNIWQADEMSYHHYYEPEVGLSFHKDNWRFPGVVVVITIDGASDFCILSETEITEPDPHTGKPVIKERIWHSTYTIPVEPGSMVIMRAPGLLGEVDEDLRPEHAVINVQDGHRIAFMLRANNRPYDESYGFEYANWPVRALDYPVNV